MSGERRAALALHALAPSDREAILADLEPGQQDILRAHLAELSELGFDPQAHAVALAPAPARAEDNAPAAVQAPRQLVEGASAAAMLDVLAHEPAVLVARLLGAGPWAWSEPFLAGLSAPRRLAVSTAMTAAAQSAQSALSAPARDRVLVELAALALTRREPKPAAPVSGMKGVTGLVARIKAWKR